MGSPCERSPQPPGPSVVGSRILAGSAGPHRTGRVGRAEVPTEKESEVTRIASVTRSEAGSRLREAERLLAEHPAYHVYRECLALQRSIEAVFLPNLRELLALLEQAATDEQLAIELVQNVRPPVVRERFQALVTQRLHNYLASTTSLVDHVRRVMRGRSDPLAEEYERRKAALRQHPEVDFMVGLRNFTLHRVLPLVGHTLSIQNVNTAGQSMASEVQLSVAELLEWKGWSAGSRTYVKGQGDGVVLRAVVRLHGELIASFSVWLHTQLVTGNAGGIEELNRLVVARNAELIGGDVGLAKRVTDEWTARRSGLSDLSS